MSGAVAFLAGLGTGYLNERDRRDERSRLDAREQRQRDREDAADARANEIYGFQKSEREQATADRAMLREAAKPVSVVPEATMPATMDARDIGQPGEAPVPVTGYKVGANRFASQGLAEAEAGRQRDTRLGAALDQVDPMGAQSRRTAGIQGQAAQLQLSEAQQAAAAREWTRKASAAIVQSGSWDAATKFMTEAKADGLDGSSQWGHQVSPDGKTVSVYPKGPNGAPLGKGFTLPNDNKGRLQLLATLDQSTPVMAKLADIRAEERAATERADKEADNKRQDARDAATERYQTGMLRNNAERTAAQLEIAALRTAAAAARQGQGGQGGPTAPIWNEKADDFLLKHYGTKDEQTGASGLDGNGANFAKIIALAASQKFGGDTMRAIAYAVDQDDLLKQAAARSATESGGKVTPQDALRTMRAQTLQRLFNPNQEAPALQAAAPVQQQQGRFSALASQGINAVKGAAQSARAEGAAYSAIDARVRQAGSGGPPLTPAEIAEARRFAIGVPN